MREGHASAHASGAGGVARGGAEGVRAARGCGRSAAARRAQRAAPSRALSRVPSRRAPRPRARPARATPRARPPAPRIRAWPLATRQMRRGARLSQCSSSRSRRSVSRSRSTASGSALCAMWNGTMSRTSGSRSSKLAASPAARKRAGRVSAERGAGGRDTVTRVWARERSASAAAHRPPPGGARTRARFRPPGCARTARGRRSGRVSRGARAQAGRAQTTAALGLAPAARVAARASWPQEPISSAEPSSRYCRLSGITCASLLRVMASRDTMSASRRLLSPSAHAPCVALRPS
jgi:hypothetical protein